MFQSIGWEDWISPDAWEDSDSGDLTSWPLPELSAPVDKLQDFHHLGEFMFDNYQLQYLLVNSTLARGRNSIQEVATVLRYKWPSQFRWLSDSDLETVLLSVKSHGEATQLLADFGNTNKFIYGHLLRPRRITPLPDVTLLVNTFKMDLREAEILGARQYAEAIELEVVKIILTSKLFSHFSTRDLALGLTHRYSRLIHSCRYVWMFPFTENHVEAIWCVSRLVQSEHFKETASTSGQQREELLRDFREDVLAGSADNTLGFDPRSYGNEKSAVKLPDEILRLIFSRANSKDPCGTLITWEWG